MTNLRKKELNKMHEQNRDQISKDTKPSCESGIGTTETPADKEIRTGGPIHVKIVGEISEGPHDV